MTDRVSSRGRMPDGSANPIDVHVGSRIRLRRTLLGLSQEKLGEALGLTFQQVQKYERGANRCGASRLFDLSRVLNVPVSFFFDDMAEEVAAACPSAITADTVVAMPAKDPMHSREMLDLARRYMALPPGVRSPVHDLVKALEEQQQLLTLQAAE